MAAIDDGFRWIPNLGPDPTALERMERHFPRPRAPMGEAWFMGDERKLYTELMEREPEQLEVELVEQVLREITGGLAAFGPHPEWPLWFHHLLPRLLPRATTRSPRFRG